MGDGEGETGEGEVFFGFLVPLMVGGSVASASTEGVKYLGAIALATFHCSAGSWYTTKSVCATQSVGVGFGYPQVIDFGFWFIPWLLPGNGFG